MARKDKDKSKAPPSEARPFSAPKPGDDNTEQPAAAEVTFPNGAEVTAAPAGDDKGTDEVTPVRQECGNCIAFQPSDKTCHQAPPQMPSAATTVFPVPPQGEKDWCRQWEAAP